MASEPTSHRPRRVLVLGHAESGAGAYIEALQAVAEVRTAASVDEALALLREGGSDQILVPASGLLTLAGAAGHQGAERILAHLAQGVCVIERAGGIRWANEAFRELPAETTEAVQLACAGVFAELDQAGAEPGTRHTRHRAMHASADRSYDLTISAEADPQGHIDLIVALVSDITAICRLRDRIDAIDAAGRELVALDADASARLEVPERLHLLEDRLIEDFRSLLNFTHFAVLVLDPSNARLDPVLIGGFPEAVRNLEIYARKEGNGISGYVAATGQSYLCPDLSKEPRYLLGLESARSSLTVPLRLINRVVGVLNVESDELNAFSEQDRQVAEIFGRYIATALHMLKLLAVERSETTTQVAADVRAELAEPLNDIVSEATRLIQAGGGGEDASHRLRAIVDRVDRVKEALQRVAETPAIRGLVPESQPTDPLLHGKRVMVADDEDIIRETIADVLSKAGALTTMARNGEEAVSMINTQRFDLVLSDIKMPYKNGYEVFAAAREANPDVQVILITGFGYDPEHSIVRASREGLAGVLFKPFAVDQLFELMHKALGAESG